MPNCVKKKANVRGTQANRLVKARITAPLLPRPAFLIRVGAFKQTSTMLRLISVVSMETPRASAPAAMIEADW